MRACCLLAQAFGLVASCALLNPPSALKRCREMAFADNTKEVAEKCKLAGDAQKWFHDNDVHDYTDVAMMASNEAETTPGIINVLVAADVESSKRPSGKIALRKFWVACRELCDYDRRPPTGNAVMTDTIIPTSENTNIEVAWKSRHNFVLPDAQLLIPTHQGRMWRDFGMVPTQITVWLAEVLRTRSCINKSVGRL